MESQHIISRPFYESKIRPYIGKQLIKILVGQRRVGKSFILKSIENEIRTKEPEANYIVINLEDFAFAHITDAASLHLEITNKLCSDRRNYIFIDEVQEVEGFDKVLRSLLLDERNDIYVTGSNSAMLSSEIASRLAGRSIETRVHPLSYAEFLVFHKFEDSDLSLQKYLRYGGLPYLRNLQDESTWTEYLSGIADALIYRDVVSRHNVRNTDFLRRLMMFLGDNIGQIITAKKIADYLKSQRVSTSVQTVQNYIEYVGNAYLVNRVLRWDIEGKKYFEIGEKCFFEDLGIRNAIVGYRPGDIGALLENTVYNKLATSGYNVRVGVLQSGKEIDFVAEKGGERVYIQVALQVDDSKTFNREFGNLDRIPDNYRKMVVTLRDGTPNTYNGIEQLSLRDFLLS